MKASQLIAQLSTLIAEHGDVTVILQGDDEGNSYRAASGADIVVRLVGAGQDDYCYNSMEEAHDDGLTKEELEYSTVVY